MENEKASTTVEIDKALFLKFKSLCVLKETTMSEQIEHMVREWVNQNEEPGAKPQEPPEAPEPMGEPAEVEDQIEEKTEQ